MKHRSHMIPCAIAILVAMLLLRSGGANPLTAGVGLAFLLCPIVMGAVMWLLMRKPPHTTSTSEHAESHKIHEISERPATSAHP